MPHPNLEHSKKILAMMMEKNDVWAITLRPDNSMIGTISLSFGKELKKQGEIGYVIDDLYWGQGLAPEAVLSVIDYAFLDLKLEKVLCKHDLDNKQSQKVIEKTGFKFVSKEKKERYDNLIVTLLVYEITKNIYMKGKNNV